MSRTLLVVSGGIEAVPGIRRAKHMGLNVVVSDGDPQAPGFSLADACLHASTYDVEATVQSASEYHHRVQPIDGVVSIAADVPLTVATVAAHLGLPGIPLEAATIAMDKLAMKDRLSADGVPVPWYSPVQSVAHLRRVISEYGYPLVLKPVDSRGARGVLLLVDGVDTGWAYELSRVASPTGRVMVERYLEGPQVSTESMLVDGVAHTPGFSDRNYSSQARYLPHVIEDGGELPSRLEAEQQRAVRDLVARAAESLGIRTGVVKGDVVFNGGEPHVIELAPRLSGGYFCTHEIPLSTGVDFVGQAILVALGDELLDGGLQPKHETPVAQRYVFPTPGEVVAVLGADEVAGWNGVALCDIRVKEGQMLGEIRSHRDRAGVVIATGRTRKEAVRLAEAAVARIQVVTRPGGE